MTPGVFVAVVVAGSLGAVARAVVTAAVARRWPRPGAGTLVANLTGAFALGLFTGAGLSAFWVEVAGTGFLGAFTTFSTWMVESVNGWREGRRGAVAVEVLATLVSGVALALLGSQLARALA